MIGKPLKTPQLHLIGYQFISLINNMGVTYHLLLTSILCLIPTLLLFILKAQVQRLHPTSAYLPYILRMKNFSSCLYNYLYVNQTILISSLILYLWHEYYENSCFELVCLFSDKEISGTAIVKPDVVPSIIVIMVLGD